MLSVATYLVLQRRKQQRELKRERTPGRDPPVVNADLPDMINAVYAIPGYSPSLNSANSLEEAGSVGFIGDSGHAVYKLSDDVIETPRMGSGTDGDMDFKMISTDSSVYQRDVEGQEGVQEITGKEHVDVVTAPGLVARPASEATAGDGLEAFSVTDVVKTNPIYAKMDSV